MWGDGGRGRADEVTWVPDGHGGVVGGGAVDSRDETGTHKILGPTSVHGVGGT